MLPVVRAARPLRVRLLRTGILFVIFTAGGIAGYCVGTMQLLDRWALANSPTVKTAEKPDRFTEWLLAQLKKDLSLTDTQYPQVEKIIRRSHQAFEEIRNKTQPLFTREMDKMERDMLAVLDEKQGSLYKSRLDRMRSSWQRPPGGGGRGHSKKGPPPDKKQVKPELGPQGHNLPPNLDKPDKNANAAQPNAN